MIRVEYRNEDGTCDSCGAVNGLKENPTGMYTPDMYNINVKVNGVETVGKLVLCTHCLHLLRAMVEGI